MSAAVATASPPPGAPATMDHPHDDTEPKHVPVDEATPEQLSALPSASMLAAAADLPVLDREGNSRPFKSLYAGPAAPQRVMVIFIRHFYCGSCQGYLQVLSETVTPAALAALPQPTTIAVVGCGSPRLIDMYAGVTGCAWPIYADPTARLYDALAMTRTLDMGARPDYQRRSASAVVVTSFVQALKALPKGRALEGGAFNQVGGEFLFEKAEEEWRVTWCHRMRSTRDHAEVPEMRRVLGLQGGSDGEKSRTLESTNGDCGCD